MSDTPNQPTSPLDDDTIALGRRHLAALRAQLNQRHTRPGPTPPTPRVAEPPSDTADPFNERMAAEMAAGAERDRLETRVTQLETEVAQLRAALATILHTAAHAIEPHHQSDTTPRPPRCGDT